MQNETTIANIRESGLAQGAAGVDKRARLLQDELGFRVADRAEYAVIASCFLPTMVPQAMKAFRRLLEHFGVDYTLLGREYCCGNMLYREAVDAKDEEVLKQADVLAREFIGNNLRQVGEVGASKIVAFCVGCDLTYDRLKGEIEQEVMWFPTLLARLFRGGKLELEADYYAGCHYYRRRLGSPPDLDSALAVLERIEGLKLNQLDQHLCCMKPQQMESLLASMQTRTVITGCGGCWLFLQNALKDRGDSRVLMLPEVVWAAVSGEPL